MGGPLEGDTVVSVVDDGTVEVVGDIDMAVGPTLEAALLQCEASAEQLVVDLSKVRFIDSSGLRVLLGASRRAHQRGSTVVLRGVGAEVTRLLEITGTTGQFSLDPPE